MFNIQNLAQRSTPFYYYNTEVLKSNLKKIKDISNKYGFFVHYAVKANANDYILQIIKEFGFGADCVSGNEVQKSVDIGFNPKHIAFAGVGKSDREINIGIDNDIFSFNCESIPEIEVINELAAAKQKIANIALRINPNIDAHTHKYITTGLNENKFGINTDDIDAILILLQKLKNVKLVGLHFHIGSQIIDYEVFKALCKRVNEIQKYFETNNIIVEHINVGGGLGIDYEHPDKEDFPDFERFFGIFHKHLNVKPQQQVHFELGRAMVAQCGSLITKVLYVKEGVNTNFAIVDAGMTELIRPALYQAYHKIENISSQSQDVANYDVVGPICESSDTFGKSISLPITARGDILAIRSAGAYGETMASKYNLRDAVVSYFSDAD